MKCSTFFIVFGLILATCNVQSAEFSQIVTTNERSITSQIIDSLEAIKQQMPCGWPQYGIPPLAPLQFSHKDLKIGGDEFSAAGEFEDFVMHGLNEFEIQQLKFSAILRKITFKFLFASLNFTTQYSMDMGSGRHFKRDGGAFFALEDLQVDGTIKYSLDVFGNKNLRLKEFKIYVSVGNVNSKVENVSSYKIINRKMNEVIEEWFMLAINENTDYLAELANEVVVPLANQMIGDKSLSDLMNLISGGGGGQTNSMDVCQSIL